MSESESSGGSSIGGSSIASDNSDSRALDALQSGEDQDEFVDLDPNNKGIQETVFSTVYTLTKNKTLDSSLRLAVLKVVLEYLQIFRVLFNSTWAWKIQLDLWIFKAIRWTLFKQLLLPKGYASFVACFYFLAALITTTLLATIWAAVVLKGDDARNVWVRRLIGTLQLFAMVVYTIFWVAILDYGVFFFNCEWTNVGQSLPVHHMYFTDKSCLALPHLAHMIFAGFLVIVFCAMTLMMSVGYTDLNPMTRNWLASADAVASVKILALKMVIVLFGAGLDCIRKLQVTVVLLAVYGVFFYQLVELPYYVIWTNLAWTGLWAGLLGLAVSLVNLELTMAKHASDTTYYKNQTDGVLYIVLFGTVVGGALAWARVLYLRKTSRILHGSFEQQKQMALSSGLGADTKGRADGFSVVAIMGDLKRVYRYRDARQVSMLCRDMRKWDEDGISNQDASDYGEYILKSGMARLPNDPSLLVMYASFLIEVRKDGQGARTQLQLLQKASPSLLDNYNIFVAQQLAKQLRRDGDGLDLMGYVEYQRNYRACVRVHKMALMAQRAFWNNLLRSDKISFRDMQRSLALMAATEARATASYRRALERYPNNGKLLKVYGRFLEYIRNDPWTANKFYAEAVKQGTTESLLNMTRGQGGIDLTAAGSINEKVDGLVIINAQGVIMMVNAAAVTMFGYDKGELEGKNVSVLMPAPSSTQHTGFLQRYAETGQPRILDKTRFMVALHKARTMFPINLMATRLAGMGSETLFMGVIRKMPAGVTDGNEVVRFWATAAGVLLCVDAAAADSFGLDAEHIVGQPFANLCADVETVNRFIVAAAESEASGPQVIQAQILHTYLPAVEVELSAQSGGAAERGSDCLILMIQARVLRESCATMALDQKARVVYATEKLSSMLGYAPAALLKMDLNALLPPPYCQMHGTWFKDLTRKPSPTSCRSGAVVHLLAANGTKVPVTLKMSKKETAGSGHVLHIVQVSKSSDTAALDQQRLLLDVNHEGVILQVNAGAATNLFGFDGSDLASRPLAAIIDVFGLWRHKFGEEHSLLTMLARQAMQQARGGAADASSAGRVSASWRVGIHHPIKDDSLIVQHAAQLASADKNDKANGTYDGNSLLHMLQQRNKLTPACMSVAMLQLDAQQLQDEAAVRDLPVMQVSLYRSDNLSAIIELDKHLGIAKAEDAVSLMLGVSTQQLLQKSFPRLLGLPPSTTFEDLLGLKHPTKKGAIKASSGGPVTSRMGVSKKVTVHHIGDGQPVTLEMQAMSYDQGGKRRMLVRLQLHEPSCASTSALLQMKDNKVLEGAAAAKLALADALAEHREASGLQRADSRSTDETDGGEGDKADGRVPLGEESGNKDSLKRTSEWVRASSKLPESPTHRQPDKDVDAQPLAHKSRAHRMHQHANYEDDDDAGEAAVYVATRQGRKPTTSSAGYDANDEQALSKAGHGGSKARRVTGPAEESYDAAPSAPGSVVESASVGGSASGGDAASEAAASSINEAGHDEDLVVDARRAKRLKKLNRMVQSGVAQAAPNRWRRQTMALLAVVLLVHVTCFAVLTQLIGKRYQNSQDIANMAHAVERFQNAVMRTNQVQKCLLAEFRNYSACNSTNMAHYMEKLVQNIALASNFHTNLYLGQSTLRKFADPRLMDYWTYKLMPEQRFYDFLLDNNGTVEQNAVINTDRVLWELGNIFIAAGKDVIFNALSLKQALKYYVNFQYVMLNGPASIFSGYAWSLDTFVDYAWHDLQILSDNLIVLLVVEVAVVLLSSMAYELYLLQQCNVSHMRLFSVFLLLPSATVRIVAQRQLQVDDDTKQDIDEDDVELMADAAAGETNEAEDTEDNEKAKAADKKKSVRMVVEDSSSGEEEKSPHAGRSKGKGGKAAADEKEGRSSGKAKGKSASGKANSHPPLTGFALYKKQAYKFFFGWMDPKFKRNGKKLMADSRVVFTFMVPLMLWVATVVVIFGVSYRKLQGLQGPLASLDTGAHVMYRLARARLMSNLLAFSEGTEINDEHRAGLKLEIAQLRREYTALMYGGDMHLQAQVSFNPVAPAAVFSSADVADLFFKTKTCLRIDQSTCVTSPSDSYYDITHSGLDALLNRYMDEMTTFALVPDNLANPDHPAFAYALKVAGNDIYDGLSRACDMFVAGTFAKFQSAKMLHSVLLAVSLVCMMAFVVLLYRPYIQLLHRDTKAVSGLLSQLPAEVDVEGHVKSVVMGSSKTPATMGQATMGPNASQNFGMGSMIGGSMPGQGGMLVPAGAMGMHLGPPVGPGVRTSMDGYPGGPGNARSGVRTSMDGYPAVPGNNRWFAQDGNPRGMQGSDSDAGYV